MSLNHPATKRACPYGRGSLEYPDRLQVNLACAVSNMAASGEELEVDEKAEEFQEQLPPLDTRKARMSYPVERKLAV